MRTRTATFPTLFAGFLALSVVGCGGSDGPDTTVAALSRPTKTALDLTKIPDSNGVVSTAAPTTLAPSTALRPTTTAPTSTVLVPATVAVSLPPGVTDADRQAAEAAAIGWWEMFYDQLVALPNFDPQEVLSRAVPGTPGGPEFLQSLEDRRGKNFRFIAGSIDVTEVRRTTFLGSDDVSVDVCTADDGYFVQAETGMREYEGLTTSFYTTVLRRVKNRWLVVDFGSYRETIQGLSCAASQ